MIRALFIIILLGELTIGYAQSAQDFLVGTHIDLIKSDYDNYFQKVQSGIEVNYFFSEKISATAGLELWTREGVSAVLGTRWYPTRDAYIRTRGLIGENVLSIGGGWAKPMTENLRFEAMTDFYFNGSFTIRIGFAYLIKRK